MTRAEIDQLIAEMIVEDLRQEPIAQYEFEELLYYYLCFDRMNSLQSAIHHEQPLGGNIMAQTYAASLPADDFVNRPAYPAEFRNAAGSTIIAGWSSIPTPARWHHECTSACHHVLRPSGPSMRGL